MTSEIKRTAAPATRRGSVSDVAATSPRHSSAYSGLRIGFMRVRDAPLLLIFMMEWLLGASDPEVIDDERR